MSVVKSFPCPVRKVGNSEAHHFFGYYNKSIWDREGRRMLAQRVPYKTRNLRFDDEAEIGFLDLADREIFHSVGRTSAWNWQMGSQLQWLEGLPGRKVVYNYRSDRAEGNYPGLAARIVDVDDGSHRDLPDPIYVVAPDSTYAVSVNYLRFMATHPTIGYALEEPLPTLALAPEDDGIYRMEISTGQTRRLVSLAELRAFNPVPSMDDAIHWVTHLEINPSGNRILFLHRWTRRVEDETCWLHRLMVINSDGSDLKLLECSDHVIPQLENDYDPTALDTFDYEKSEYQISHPTWRDDTSIMVWGPHAGKIHYHLYDVNTGSAQVVGDGILTENGHMTYSPDGRWMVSDTYPDKETQIRKLFLYEIATGDRYDVADLVTDPALGKENRCDLHPRWHPDGQSICVDSVHEGERQLYVVDVSRLIEATG